MGNKKNDPFFDLTQATGISLCVRYWLDETVKKGVERSIVLEKLKVIFGKESNYAERILDDSEFTAVFRQKIGKRRAKHLKTFLKEIDAKRYGKMNYQF